MQSIDLYFCSRDPLALERAARQYRQAAHLSEAKATWTGQLMPKHQAGKILNNFN